ncbi:hypothetical protein J4558_19395 [Leptolyngbya sp. 15MV]|nr:hypothetical protein J4558_19395 [Leptolyngbya sp. 15MV]
MRYLSRLNPAGGFADFWHEFRRPNPYRWPILFVSFMITGGILSLIIWDEVRIPPPRPEVTYITTFEPGRTDAEIAASNLANQQVQDELRAAAEERAELRREIYRDLGRATGMDVDAIDARVARERAADEAAREARRRELVGETVAEQPE